MSAERWKDIPGYEGIYEASESGSIRSKPGKATYTDWHGRREWKTRELKPKICGRGDRRVTLWKDGQSKDFLVARLVAMTWVDGYAPELTVNHIDGDYSNNHRDNLEWVTLGENVRKGFEAGLFAGIEKPVCLERIEGGGKLHFRSLSSADRFLGRSGGYVHNCIRKGRNVRDEYGCQYRVVG